MRTGEGPGKTVVEVKGRAGTDPGTHAGRGEPAVPSGGRTAGGHDRWARAAVQVSAFAVKSWRMTRRNVFTVFEVVFWPVVGLLSVGLLAAFLGFGREATVFVLVGIAAQSVVHVCQLDLAYAVLFDMWAKSLRQELLAPVQPWHLALGAWSMGVLRGTVVFALLAAVSRAAFGVDLLAPGWLAVASFLGGLLLSAAGIGLAVASLLLLFGLRAEVSAWSGVSLIFLLCGIYYPVSLLPGPVAALASAFPLTYVLEAFRAHYGFDPGAPAPALRGWGLALAYGGGAYGLLVWSLARARWTGMLLRLSD